MFTAALKPEIGSEPQQLTADGALLFVTAVWGATFVMVQEAVAGFPVFAFLGLRFILATAVLLPFSCAIVDRGRLAVRTRLLPLLFNQKRSRSAQTGLLPGIAVGLALFAGYAFQTFGLR